MIDVEFNGGAIDAVNFGVCLRSNGNIYFVPTDVGTKDALRAIYRETVAAFGGIQTDWEAYDISEIMVRVDGFMQIGQASSWLIYRHLRRGRA